MTQGGAQEEPDQSPELRRGACGPGETRAPGVGGAEPHGGSLEEVCGGSWSLHLSASHCVHVRIASRAGKKTTTQRIGANSPGRRHREERGEVPVPTSQRGSLVVRGYRCSTQKGVASIVGNYRSD